MSPRARRRRRPGARLVLRFACRCLTDTRGEPTRIAVSDVAPRVLVVRCPGPCPGCRALAAADPSAPPTWAAPRAGGRR